MVDQTSREDGVLVRCIAIPEEVQNHRGSDLSAIQIGAV